MPEPPMASEVEVRCAPATAFSVFTEEMDLWWVRSPISFYDGARAVGVRLEPGVGGRILEEYPDGEPFVIATITRWEPGRRLAWDSAVDDVSIDVTFSGTQRGTLVRVAASIREGGRVAGGLAYVRVVPAWLPAWIERRDGAAREPVKLGRLALLVRYERPIAAARWLRDVFGLDCRGPLPDTEAADPDEVWIEFHVGDCSLVVLGLTDLDPAVIARSHEPMVFVDDLREHHDRSVTGGAKVVQPIRSHGFTAYVAEDLEGHRWTFAQAGPTYR